VEAGKIVESTFITKLLDAVIIFDEQLACMTHADFNQELRIRFSCSRLEEATE